MRKLWTKTHRSIRVLAVASLILALINSQLWALEKERPSTGAIIIDVPIRFLSLGLVLVSTAIFIVTLPFSLTSGSTRDTADALVIEPLEFIFKRPLGKFEDWRSDVPSAEEGLAND